MMTYTWPVFQGGVTLELSDRIASAAAAYRLTVPTTWPEGESFVAAEQAQAIGAILRRAFHPELKDAVIRYLFRETMGSDVRPTWGKAQKASGLWRYVSKVDFTLTFNWKVWCELNVPQLAALVDHELQHCSVKYRDDGGADFVTVPHDLEEFQVTVARWGLWRPAVANFIQAAPPKPQLELELSEDRVERVPVAEVEADQDPVQFGRQEGGVPASDRVEAVTRDL